VLSRVPDGALSFVYLLHPDPWPKARHAKRRMMSDGPVGLFAAKLRPGGEFRFGTDHPVYLRHALMVMRRHAESFEWLVEGPGSWQQRPAGWIETRYEAKARRLGHEVWYLPVQEIAMSERTALIIGASRGIGLGLAEELAKRGWHVFATQRSPGSELERAAMQSGGRIEVLIADVTDRQSLAALARGIAPGSLDGRVDKCRHYRGRAPVRRQGHGRRGRRGHADQCGRSGACRQARASPVARGRHAGLHHLAHGLDRRFVGRLRTLSNEQGRPEHPRQGHFRAGREAAWKSRCSRCTPAGSRQTWAAPPRP
jgi:hypothetical protein